MPESLKRKIGEVYEFPYRCGHMRQYTLVLHPFVEPDMVALNRVVAETVKQCCVICDPRFLGQGNKIP